MSQVREFVAQMDLSGASKSESAQGSAATTGGGLAKIAETNVASSTSGANAIGMDPDIFTAAGKGDLNALSKYGMRLREILTPTENSVLHIYIAYASCPTLTESRRERSSVLNVLIPLALSILIAEIQSEMHRLRKKNTSSPTLSPSQIERSNYIVSELLQVCPPLLLQPNNDGDTALHVAAKNGLDGIVQVLIQMSKSLHVDLEKQVEEAWEMLRKTNKEGETALHKAARFNHLGVVKILTKEASDFTSLLNTQEVSKFSCSTNFAGDTPIYLAAERGYGELVSELLKSCTEVADFRGHRGRTALHAAVIRNDKEMTGELLNKKESLAIETDEFGWTPLHFASLMGHTEIVKQLLKRGRSATYIGDKVDNKTALHIAVSNGHEGVVKEIISHCSDCCELVDRRRRNILHYASESKTFSYLLYIVGHHPWLRNILLNGKDVDGNTPLHQLAASMQHKKMISEDCFQFIDDDGVDRMALNMEYLNAVDIISTNNDNPFAPGKSDTEKVLRWNGAVPSQENAHRKIHTNTTGIPNEDKGAKKTLLLVATLIATVSFAAGFAMPGGYLSYEGPDKGFAVLSKVAAFKAYVITNTIAMVLSSGAVLSFLYTDVVPVLFRKHRANRQLQFQTRSTMLALMAMSLAFATGTYAVLGNSSLAIVVCVLVVSAFGYPGLA